MKAQKLLCTIICLLGLAGLTLATNAQAQTVRDGIILYLPFDGNALDASATSHSVTVIGTEDYAPGMFGQAMDFDGTTDTLDLGPVAGSPFAFGDSVDFSVAVWVKPLIGLDTDYYWAQIISNKDFWSGTNPGYALTYDNLQWHLNFTTDANPRMDIYYTQNDIYDGNWHLFTCTVTRGGDAVLYIDGVETGRNAIPAGSLDTTLHTFIGRDGNYYEAPISGTEGHHYRGLMDDFVVWNRAITAAEVEEIYNTGMTGNTAVPVEISDFCME